MAHGVVRRLELLAAQGVEIVDPRQTRPAWRVGTARRDRIRANILVRADLRRHPHQLQQARPPIDAAIRRGFEGASGGADDDGSTVDVFAHQRHRRAHR